jgi:hypothetical protein
MIKSECLMAYFENMAEHHPRIAHVKDDKKQKRFGVWDMLDTHGLNGLNLSSEFFALILHQYEGEWTGPNRDRLMDRAEVSFRVVRHAAKDDVRKQMQVHDEAKAICRTIISKIMRDREEFMFDGSVLYKSTDEQENFKVLDADGGLIELETGEMVLCFDEFMLKVSYYPVKPTIDSEYGCAVELVLAESVVLEHDETMWNFSKIS